MTNPLRVRVCFYAPESTVIEIPNTDPGYALYQQWEETGSDKDWEEFVDRVAELTEEHVVQWTMIDEVSVEDE